MALTYITYTGDGTTNEFLIPFDYIKKEYLHFYINNEEVDSSEVSWDSENQISFSSPPESGASIFIRRETEIEEPLVDFRDGSTLTEDELDTETAQLLHLIQENRDISKGDLDFVYEIPWLVDTVDSITPDSADGMYHIGSYPTPESASYDASGYPVKTAGTSTYRTLRQRFGDFINLKDYGAVGNGTDDDTTAWNNWQTALQSGGLGYIPAGDYLVNGSVKHFASGCLGNGKFDDTLGYWSQVHRNPTSADFDDGDNLETDTILQHQVSYDASNAVNGPIIKTQSDIAYTMTDGQVSANFTRVIGAYHEGVGHGNYECSDDNHTGNFTTFASTAHNKFAGNFGMTAITGRVWDASETEVPNVATYGASKSCAGYFPFIRKAKHVRGGYMIGLETYCMNNAEETADIAYENSDTFTFGGAWTAGYHCTGYGGSATGSLKGAPISAGIMIDGASGARHAFWNAIVIGSSSMKINNDNEGHAGTVGINFASWRSGRYGDQAIRFGYANHHLHFKSGARIWSPSTVIGCDYVLDSNNTQDTTADVGVMVMAPSGGTPYISFVTGTLTGTRTTKYGIRVNSTSSDGNAVYNLRSGSSHVFAFTSGSNTTYAYNLNTGYFTCSGEQKLGTGSSLWGQIYSTNATIETSDERLKQDIATMDDTLLDAWADINWTQFRFKDAVAEKGSNARTHTGLIAQRVKTALDSAGIDSVQYGFLCHDEWGDQYDTVTVEDEPEHLNENEELIPAKTHEEQRLVKEAGDRWSLRYEEALCIEAAYVRRELARIKAQIGMN